MAEVLRADGIKCVELPRIGVGNLPITATQVRKAFAANDMGTLGGLVPPATLEFLQSSTARPIAERLRTKMEEA
jgi:citrate lyase synthetase